MAIFQYKALNQSGKEIKGKLDAPNQKLAIQQLKSQQFYVLSMQLVDSPVDSPKKRSFRRLKVADKQITAFTRQLAIMLDTGVSYDKSLEILIQETKDQVFQNILSEVRTKVLSGITLSKSLEQFPTVFSSMYTAIIRAGEEGGDLPAVMMRQAQYREEQAVMKSKVQTAMIYPMVMSVMGFGIMVFMISFILPRIIPVFDHFGVALPLPTQIVIGLSNLITEYGFLLILLSIGGFVGAGKYFRTDSGLLLLHSFLLKIPLLKDFLQKLYTLRFIHSLGSLLKSGIDMQKSLEMSTKVIGSKAYEKVMETLFRDISQKGFSLSAGLKKTGLYSDSLVQMIRVGEESGQMEDLLAKMTSALEVEVKQTLEKVVALLEPIIILVMALGVGFIVLAVLLPMFDMNQLF